MTLFGADHALEAWSVGNWEGQSIAVFSPSFREWREKSSSTWQALQDLFVRSERLGVRLGLSVGRDQGRLIALAPGDLEVEKAARLVSSHSKRAVDFHLGVFDISSVRALAHFSSAHELLELTSYLALINARRAEKSRIARSISDVSWVSMHTGHADRRQMAHDLYPAVPLGGRQVRNLFDPLTSWYRISNRQRGRDYLCLTDINDTKGIFRPQVEEAAAAYDGDDVLGVVKSVMAVRQQQNAVLEEYFSAAAVGFPSLFRASGDGLVGFIDSPENLQTRLDDAARASGFRIHSAAAVAPAALPRNQARAALEVGLSLAKLLKDHPALRDTVVNVSEPIPRAVRCALRATIDSDVRLNAHPLYSEWRRLVF